MPRYYVSFSFAGVSGFAVGSADITTPDPIASSDDLKSLYGFLAQQGFRDNVKILGFSLYATPTHPAATPQPIPAPQPHHPTPKPQHHSASQPPRRRPSPRPGRPS
ncbi:hypothetical protein AB0M36_34695 [Actinoplanes sp. NPDC051346]|uniref:hypothetical protein n=1 Tax=Actinoplanes sp. NPDC051346 TaxID=3155048 RepID=UPI00342FEEC9